MVAPMSTPFSGHPDFASPESLPKIFNLTAINGQRQSPSNKKVGLNCDVIASFRVISAWQVEEASAERVSRGNQGPAGILEFNIKPLRKSAFPAGPRAACRAV
jgi:hypothetical protein